MIFNHNSNLLPPLADFISINGLTIDIKSDRYNIDKLGAIIPNEKLNDIHIADYTFWLECNENNLKKVIIHAWSNRQDLITLKDQPNATRKNGSSMPKSCKRIPKNQMRKLDDFIDTIQKQQQIGIYQIAPTRVP